MNNIPEDLSLIANEQTLTGTTFGNWFRLLWNNKFKISWKFLHKFLIINLMLVFTSPFILYEKLRFNRRIRKTKIEHDPIFILGHWRSGTSYLHMLLTRDKHFSFASNFQVFMPHVFLGSRKLFRKIVKDNMPKTRRQDNFELHVDNPSEEDFAISNMSNYSFYHGLSFPRRRKFYSRYISFQDVSAKEISEWKKTYLFYIKKLTYANDGKRLVLKNPPNTARIKQLLEIFPNAKFVHIFRNPYDVYPSTLRMYNNLIPPFFLQKPEVFTAEEIVFDVYEEMHRVYFQERELIPKGNLIEVSYENFLQDPFKTVEKIYNNLSLEDFDEVKHLLKGFIHKQKSYKTNIHNISPEIKAKINSRWKESFEKFGYEIEQV